MTLRNRIIFFVCLAAVVLWPCKVCASASVHEDSLLLGRIFSYRVNYGGDISGYTTHVYMRHGVKTLKKNKLLIMVPTMYTLARKKDSEFLSESYSKVTFEDVNSYSELRHVVVGTVPRYRLMLPTMTGMLTPTLYEVTLMKGRLLSPFHHKNRKFYRYGVSEVAPTAPTEGRGRGRRMRVAFIPKTRNTQTVKGTAIVDFETGRIEEVELTGEYDMISFELKAEMGLMAPLSLIPRTCDMKATFHMAGNRIEANYHAHYGMQHELPDTLVDSHDREIMDMVRPHELTDMQNYIYHKADSIDSLQTTLPKKVRRRNMVKHVMWDIIGDNLVNRIKGNFGKNNEGMFKIYPILDPLSLSYSERKGFTYKMRLRGSYAFTPNQELSLYFRGGYSFKQEQFYFRLPVKYTFDRRHDGHVELEVGNGNRITNRSIVEQMIDEMREDSARIESLNLDYFKDTYMKLRANYDISNRWSLGAGLTFHRRSAVDKEAFRKERWPTTYHSLAPMVETQIRPWGWNGPIFTINYEQGIKGLGKANMEYGRLETDAVWLRRFNRLRSLSMRAGAGLYTMKDKDAYFLDFENFREDNMPSGWSDDWTGEFQLLKRDDYNSSVYYVRTNLTYESPLFFLSHAPLLGKYVEMERIYLNTLLAKDIHPYSELGYGFTCRIFSIGLFVGMKNGHYDGFGCRVGLELFRDW